MKKFFYLSFIIVGGVFLFFREQETRKQSLDQEEEIVREFKSSNLEEVFTEIEAFENEKKTKKSRTRDKSYFTTEQFSGVSRDPVFTKNIVSLLNASKNRNHDQRNKTISKILESFIKAPNRAKENMLSLWDHPQITQDGELFSEIISLTSYLPTDQSEFIQKAEDLVEYDTIDSQAQTIDELQEKGQFKKIKMASEFVVSEKLKNDQPLDTFLVKFFDSQSNSLIRRELIFHVSLYDKLKAKKLELKYLGSGR